MENTVLTLEQAARYLQVSPEDLQSELEEGRIPGRKFGGKWRVHRESLDRLLGAGSNNDNASLPTVPPVVQPRRASVVNPPKKPSPATGTPQSQELYQKAAVARTEGRFDEARHLFRQAIKAGGGVQVYAPFIKMEIERGRRPEAKQLLQQAMQRFPDDPGFYDMYGQMERRARNYSEAEEIFREGLQRFPEHFALKKGLAQTLVQIGTDSSFREAGNIFQWLEQKGKLDRKDSLYIRYHSLQRNPRANKAFDFFRDAGMRVGIAGKRDLPQDLTDIVFEANLPELSESFGLTGYFLVRCLQRCPQPVHIINLQEYLRKLSAQEGILGLQDREVVVNTSLAFIAVNDSKSVRDMVTGILSKNEEVIIPLDDEVLQNSDHPLNTLRDLLGRYLGQRDLYSSTLPVSGRRFFGREHLLHQLTDLIHQGQFLGIFGLRKMGKTSLVYQLRDEKLRGEAVAYIDLQESGVLFSTGDCAPLYWMLERNLYLRLKAQQQEDASLLRLGNVDRFSDLPDHGAAAALLFNEDMRSFLDALHRGTLDGIHRLVFMVDELERILPVAGQPGLGGYLEFFGLLRGLAQQYQGVFSCVVVAANAAISERGYWEGRENPVFALYKPIFLPPLLQKECAEMILTLGKGMSVYWEPEAVQAVFDETGGHPFLTRSFCSRIAKTYSSRPLTVTAAMVQEQILPFIRGDGDKLLAQITELLSTNFPQEDGILEQIALGEAPSDLPDESLRHLLGYSLVNVDDNGYQITLNLLRRWLRRRAGVKE
ncbi:MAG: helix-turn-helix domain-containing protein [Chloroflexaceae bacterium]|nr:helix-turn-helix domain-containing protein [Chloroflexaceae bacterium]